MAFELMPAKKTALVENPSNSGGSSGSGGPDSPRRGILAWLASGAFLVRRKKGLNARFKKELAGGLKQMRRHTRESEGGILRLGEEIQELYQAAQAMTRQGSRVVELVSGQSMSQTGGRLEALVQQIGDRFQESRNGFAENLKTLAVVRGEVAAASRPLAVFQQMVMGLRVLGISTRIESARMQGSDEGFQFLAEEVGRLADTIKEQTEGMDSQLGSLGARLDQALSGMKGLSDSLSDGAGDLASAVDQSLEGLRQWRDRSEQAAEQVARSTRRVHDDMAEAVSSMQFHDITRQRLEHVQEALSALIDGRASAPAGEICGLQAALLTHAEQELGQAVDSMQNSLLGIAGSVRQVAGEASLLAGGEEGRNESVLARLQGDLSAISDIAGQTEQALVGLRDLMSSVVETLEQVGSSLSAIDSISYSIKFVALNAAIKSARLGNEGAALESLAQAIQQLSGQAHRATRKLTKVLGHLGDSAESLRQTMKANAGSGQEAVAELESLLSAIRGDNQACDEILAELEQDGRQLASRLEQGAAGIVFHLAIRQGVSQVMDCLNRHGEKAGRKAFKPGSREFSAQFARHYTMASERQIHQEWTQGEAAGGTAPRLEAPQPAPRENPAAPEEPGEDREFGDNVELF